MKAFYKIVVTISLCLFFNGVRGSDLPAGAKDPTPDQLWHLPLNQIIYVDSLRTWAVFYPDQTNKDGIPYLKGISSDSVYYYTFTRGGRFMRVPDIDGKWCYITYGFGGLILNACYREDPRADTVVYAKEITDVVFSSPANAYAIVKAGDDKFYLAKAEGGKWQRKATPLMIRKTGASSVRRTVDTIFSTVLLLGLAMLSGWIWLKIRLRKLISNLEKEEKEKENPIFTKADHPLGMNDEDLLGFNDIETALIDVLRNPKTALPLTVVISGKWGSGKSSMMNRIRQRLENDPETKDRFLTTWFNAWHLQGENNLLNTFLISMAKFYEKSFLGFFRFRLFRLRLLKLSGFKQFLFWVAFSTAFFVSVLVLYKVFIVHMFGVHVAVFDEYLHRVGLIVQNWGSLQKNGQSFFVLLNILAGALSLYSVLFFGRELKPWGLNTFTELLNVQKFQLDAETNQPGHREKFKEDFWDILAASNRSQKTVVFIDDIDRISGTKILELLEAINFIGDTASAPALNRRSKGEEPLTANMIFVLGMATEEVACNLGKRLAELNDSDRKAQDLGLDYIEKMVQLVVSIPFDESNEKLKDLARR